MKENLENEIIDCGEAKVLETVTFEEDGVKVTEELLELTDIEGRASTIFVKYKAGSHYLDVTFSSSGHGSGVYCGYRVGSMDPLRGGGYNIAWDNKTRYKSDVQRNFSSIYVSWPPKPAGSTNNYDYYFEKKIYSNASSSSLIRTYTWKRYLGGTGSTN